MKNTFGNQLSITIFGESHGEAIGVVMDGIAAGIKLDLPFIAKQMKKRKAKGKISTKRQEEDKVHIVSGYFNGYTTGSPITILIKNEDARSKDYEKNMYRCRPSHADYTADVKYRGFQDYRGGGHFSGRITAPLVAAGAIALQVLQDKGITIGSHILQCKDIHDRCFDQARLYQDLCDVNAMDFAVLDREVAQRMTSMIEEVAAQGDSVGGVLESAVHGLPAGIGEPFFDSMESCIAHALFSVPAVKGVAFGSGFDFANMCGSEANDAFLYENGVKTRTNHNGGINGGISNGMPILIKTSVKPTPSIYIKQDTIDLRTHEAVTQQIEGRHDPAIIHRARVVVDSAIALAILDEYMAQEATVSMIKKGNV